MNMPADAAPEQHDDDAHGAAADTPPEPPTPAPPTPTPLTQSSEDTDVGWGDYRERDDDDRLLRDRPPHWDNT